MQCIKTGAHAYIKPHGDFLYGDMFACDLTGLHIMRVCDRGRGPKMTQLHFIIQDWPVWFDERQTSGDQNSTLVIQPHAINNLGYGGIKLSEVQL